MSFLSLLPSVPILLLLAAFLSFFLTRWPLNILLLSAPVVALIIIALATTSAPTPIAWFALETTYFHPYSRLFTTAFAFVLLAGLLYSAFTLKRAEAAAALILAASAIGMVCSGDIITFFIYSQLAGAGIVMLLWSEGEEGQKAGTYYFYLHLLSGFLLLSGIALHQIQGGTLHIADMHFALNSDSLTALISGNFTSLPAILMLMSLLIPIGLPPFSTWLTNALPIASPTGSIFILGFQPLAAFFAIMTLFTPSTLLLWLGLVGMGYGVFYALLENNLRRLIGFIAIAQFGLLLTLSGLSHPLSPAAVGLYAVSTLAALTILLMLAGYLLSIAKAKDCSAVPPLYRIMPKSFMAAFLALFSLSGLPLTFGFIAHGIVVDTAFIYHMQHWWLIWICISFAMLLPLFLLMATLLGVFHTHAPRKSLSRALYRDPPVLLLAGIGIPALSLVFFGIAPGPLLALLGLPDIRFFALDKILHAVQMIFSALIGFYLLLPLLKRSSGHSVEYDWLWRVGLKNLLLAAEQVISYGYQLSIKCYAALRSGAR